MLGMGKMNKLNISERLNLWVLPVSMRIDTFLFFICPCSFSVCGWDITVMDANDIFGVSYSSYAL